jgi:hypothetical protein
MIRCVKYDIVIPFVLFLFIVCKVNMYLKSVYIYTYDICLHAVYGGIPFFVIY